jgi:squalene synthase HpnC
MPNSLHLLAKKHYENFPVGSVFIKKQFREPIHLIYAFARVADDISDEGTMSVAERLTKLNRWEMLLVNARDGKPEGDFFASLSDVMHRFKIPLQLFTDLLHAFKKDAENPVYSSFSEVLEYCTYSANPIGRMLLKIFDCSNEQTERYSDAICTALQLTNFYQDISIDTGRNRLYIAREELDRFHITRDDLRTGTKNDKFAGLMKEKVVWTKTLFESGKPLVTQVRKDFQFELKLIWLGGMRILEKIEALQYDTRSVRPQLTGRDNISIFFKALSL